MFALLSFLWFFRTTKVALFYFYLWQLKEYRLSRFLDHFRTEKGKKLILNKINLIKGGIFLGFLFVSALQREISRTGREGFLKLFLGILIFLYVVEFIFAFKNIFQRKLKIPVLTKKAVVLIFAGFFVEIIILFIFLGKLTDIFYFAFWLLFFDIFAPVISSLIILLTQPLTILLKNQIIKKAKIKRLGYKNLIVIGITGSYGKTSTKEFLATILSEKFRVLKTKEHQNNEMGVSRCILNELRNEHSVFVVEMGAYKSGEIKLLCDITKPKIGILTGINEQHLALFGSQYNIIKTKYELIENLPKDGIAIFNGDNKYCLELYKITGVKKKIYNSNKLSLEKMLQSDIWGENIKIEKEFISFQAQTKDGETADFKLNVLGGHNIANILAAALCAKELGMTLQEISKACLKIKPGQGAMKLIKGKEDINILDASYSANPDGVISNLDYLKIWGGQTLWQAQGKRVIVMPCLIELGSASKEVHKRIGKKIGEVCDLAIITTKERFEEIREGAVEAGMKKENILFIENIKEIMTQISIFCGDGDTVLFEGRAPKTLIEELKSKS